MTVDDPPSAYQQGYRTARKSHRCYECSSEIRPGDRYRFDSGVWDKRGASYKTCLTCEALRNWLGDLMAREVVPENEHVDGCGQWVFGGLSEACDEAFHEWKIENDRCDVHFWIPKSRQAVEHEECEL